MTVYRVPNSTNEDDLIDLDIYSQSDAQSMFEDGSETEEDVSGERWIVLKLTYENFKKFEKDSESKFFIPILGPEKTEGQTVKSRLTWIKVALTAGRVGIPEINDGGSEIPTKISDLENDSGFIDEQGVKKVYNTNNQQYLDSDGKHYQYYSEPQPWTLTATPEFEDGTLELDEEYLEASNEWSYTLNLVPSDQGEDVVLETFTSQTQLTQFSHYVTYQDVQYTVDGNRIGQGWNEDWELAKTSDIPSKTSELTNDAGFITSSDIPTIPTKTSDLTNDSGFITIDKTYYQFDKTADLSAAVFDPNTVYIVETDTSTPSTWTISLNVTQTGYPANGVMDCVLLVEDLTQIPTTITVGISNGAVPRFFGDTFDAIDAANHAYIITFTVLNWDARLPTYL